MQPDTEPTQTAPSGRAAQLAAAIAAAPLRRISVRERGTVLLLIVGVLAMLSIIAVVYAAIGRADRLGSAAFRRESEIEDFVRRTVDYHLQIISNDLFDTVTVNGIDASGAVDPTYRVREMWDHPSITAARTDPTATPPNRYAPTGADSGTDPWLADIEPQWDSSATGADDWRKISDVAPGGVFVNLWNLRPPTFRFDSPAGTDAGDVSSILVRGDASRSFATARSELETPSKFAADQVDAFGPAGSDSRSFRNTARQASYSWADADGDGISDSRWWIPEDASDFFGSAVTNPAVRSVIPSEGNYRYVLATRIIDLCGLVNVNTAMDLRDDPTGAMSPAAGGTQYHGYLAGVTPADVDARRLLRLEGLPTGVGGYSGIDPPVLNGGVTPPFGSYDPATIGDLAYQGVRETLETGSVPTALLGTTTTAEGRSEAYEAFAAGLYGAGWGSPSSGTFAYTTAPAFGAATELELRTFNGANDSDNTSKLEAAVAGRDPSVPKLDPLRSWRSTYFERGVRDVLPSNGAGPDGLLDPHAEQQARVDIRHLITVLSGARPLATRLINLATLPAGAADELTRDDVKINPFEEMFEYGPAPTPGDPKVITGLSETGLQRVFGALFECLAPFATSPAVWDVGPSGSHRDLRTASYGGSAEFAMHAAASTLANWADAFDDDDIPTRLTVEVSAGPTTGAGTIAPQTDPNNYFTPGGTGDWRRGKLTLAVGDNNTPADKTDDTYARPDDLGNLLVQKSFNVYGIEPQPVLTEVTSFIVFTDSPNAGNPYGEGGDDETVGPNGIPGDGDESNAKITLDGEVSLTNPDFLVEVLAFQIANPFSTPLTIGSADDNTYYIEYGGHFYPLVMTGSSDVVLGAHEARVFYTTSQTETAGNEIDLRFQSALGTGESGNFARLINAQLTCGLALAPPIRILGPFQPQNLDRVNPPVSGSLIDLHGPTGASSLDRRVVNLWRGVIDTGAGTSGVESRGANSLSNDILVDRIRNPNPGIADLDLRSVLTGGPEVAGSSADSQGTGDNRGFTAIFWRGWLRPSWSGGSVRGAVPPWAIEAKFDNDSGRYSGRRIWNDVVESASFAIGSASDYQAPGGGPNELGPTYFGMLADMIVRYGGEPGIGPTIPGVELHKEPDHKSGNPIGSTPATAVYPSGRTFTEAAIELQCRGPRTAPGNPGLFTRPGDLLLTLAIGPWNAPELANGLPAEDEFEWMTLSEALALSMDYYTPGLTAGNPNQLFYRTAAGDPAAGIPPRLDRGHLFLDRHVPFVDDSHDGKYDTGETVLGLGVPLAWHVLDRFRTDDAGSLTVAKPGVINANTAPARVLRVVPMLSPDFTSSSWGASAAGVSLLAGGDIAGSIAAYRDRENRTALDGVTPLDFSNPDREAKSGIFGLRPDNRAAFPLAALPGAPSDRGGLFSLGEILAARDKPSTAIPPPPGTINDIDYLARDTVSMDSDALEAVRYNRSGGGVDAPAPGEPDQILNEYDEQLAIANAALNSLSIRSDVFCVWFVVQGYLPSDVEGLTPDDPLVPSLARRYVMVVDRSNVTKRGDKPRVLFLQEVPM